MKRIVGLVGAGREAGTWAPHLYREDVDLVIYDPDAPKAHALAEITEATVADSLEALCARGPAIVIVTTDPSEHTEVAETVLAQSAGLKTLVLGSWPITFSAEAEAIIRAADAARVAVYRPLTRLIEAEGILDRFASDVFGPVHYIWYLGLRRGEHSEEGQLAARSAALALFEAVTDPDVSRRVMLHEQGDSEVLTVQLGTTVASARLRAGVELAVGEQVQITVLCEHATVRWVHETTTAPVAPDLRMPVIFPHGAATFDALHPQDGVRTSSEARAAEVARLLTLQPPPVNAGFGLRVLADEWTAAQAALTPGKWLTVEDRTHR
jgi:hypothetical protein